MTSYEPRGVYVPLITPFEADGRVAYESIPGLVFHYADAGVAGIVALGTTGEPSALTAEERAQVVATIADACHTRGLELIVGAGTNSTATTIETINGYAATPGLRAVLVVSPYYVRPSQAGILAHYRAIAEATTVPVIVYNIPARTGSELQSATLLDIARLPRVVGLKQAVGGVDAGTLTVLEQAPRSFAVLSGDDAFIVPTILMGGAGAIAASAHVCPARFVDMVDCALNGKLDDARAHADALLPVVQAGFAEPNPSVFKGVLHAQGLIPSPLLRLPLLPAAAASIERALAAIATAS